MDLGGVAGRGVSESDQNISYAYVKEMFTELIVAKYGEGETSQSTLSMTASCKVKVNNT